MTPYCRVTRRRRRVHRMMPLLLLNLGGLVHTIFKIAVLVSLLSAACVSVCSCGHTGGADCRTTTLRGGDGTTQQPCRKPAEVSVTEVVGVIHMIDIDLMDFFEGVADELPPAGGQDSEPSR